MLYGLSEEILNEIIGVVSAHKKVESIILFGSRAKGNFSAGSDIDLAVIASGLTYNELTKIQADLDQLELIYKLDVVDYNKISEPALKEHIERVGKVVYSRK